MTISIPIPDVRGLPEEIGQRVVADQRELGCEVLRQYHPNRVHLFVQKLQSIWLQYPLEHTDTVLFLLAKELFSAIREKGGSPIVLEESISTLATHQNRAAEFLGLAALSEAQDSFREAVKPSSPLPHISEYLPVLPEGDEYDKLGAQVLICLLEEYCSMSYEFGGDPMTECWDQLPGRFRRPPYTNLFCNFFRLKSPGDIVSNRYRLEDILGIGGMGVVYKAVHLGFVHEQLDHARPHYVALKGPRPDCENREQFALEGQRTERIDDPRFLRIRDAELGAEVEWPFFTMDLVENGRILTDLIDHPERFSSQDLEALRQAVARSLWPEHDNGTPSNHALGNRRMAHSNRLLGSKLNLTVGIVWQVADAIHYLHGRGYLHRDLKPGNILIDKVRGIRVGDLGLSHPVAGIKPDSIPFAGTPAYMSPEQVIGAGLTIQSDVYQLGAVLYRSITGHAPHTDPQGDEGGNNLSDHVRSEVIRPPRQLNRAVSRDLEAVCLKALAKDRGRRYGSAQAFADDLKRYLNGDPVHARPGHRRRAVVRKCLRSPVTYAFLFFLALSLGSGSIFYQSYQQVDGCEASRNRYRARDLVPPPTVEVLQVRDPGRAAFLIGALTSTPLHGPLPAASLLGPGVVDAWPNPDYSHVKIESSSIYFDLTRWRPIPPGTTPDKADRSVGEPALYTRVIKLARKKSVSRENSKVSFQFRTEGNDVDLACPSHPYRVYGSPARERLGGGTKPVLIREIEIDLAQVPKGEDTTIVLHGTIWNGFQRQPPPLCGAVAMLTPQPLAAAGAAVATDDSRQWAAFLAPDDLSEGEIAVRFPKDLKPTGLPRLFSFARGAPRQEAILDAQVFAAPRNKDWWLWRPQDIRRNRVYQLEWRWNPPQTFPPK